MSAFLEMAAAWLIDYFAAATIVLAAALVVRSFVRQPAARMAAAWSACLGLVAVAVLTALPMWPRIAVEDLPPIWPAPITAQAPPAWETSADPATFPAEAVAFAAPIEISQHEPMAALPIAPADVAVFRLARSHMAAGAWLAAAAMAIGWVLLGRWRTSALLRTAVKAPAWAWDELKAIIQRTSRNAAEGKSQNATEGKSRNAAEGVPYGSRVPALWASRKLPSAVALGALSPQIILPASSLAESNRSAVQAALAHEWAHIRHGDLWLLAIERLLLPLLALHPLFWWLRRCIRLDQELLADAAAAGDKPAEYAEALLIWARTDTSARHGLAALSMWEHPSTLSRRVAMILDSKQQVARPLSRACVAVTCVLALPAILVLSVLSLNPSTAQDQPAPDEPAVAAAEPAPLSRRPSDAPPAPRASSVPVTQVQLELLVASVSREKLSAADTTLEDAIAEATESRCRKEAGLVVSEIKPEEVVKLLDGLKKHEAIKVLSRPQVMTLDGREANVHVGGEVPLLRVEETINGKHERRVEFKEFGTMLMVRPKLTGEKGDLVKLDILAEQASLVPPGEKAEEGAVPRDVPGLVSHKFTLTSDVKLGGTLLVAESPADKKQLRDAVKEQFLLIVTPQRAIRTVAAVYADPREGEKGEAARAATEAALDKATAAATNAEPEGGAAATRSRTEPADPTKFASRVFRIAGGDMRALAARFDELVAKSALAGQKVAANFKGDHIEVYAPAESMAEVTKLIQSLGGEPIGEAAPMPPMRTRASRTAAQQAGTGDPAHLQGERDARAKETADLKRQIELLQRQVEKLQAATGTQIMQQSYKIRHRKAAAVADDLKVLLSEPLANGDVQLTVDDSTNSIFIQLPGKHVNDFGRTVEALDRTSPPATNAGQPPNEYTQAIWRALAEKRNRLGAGQQANPLAAEPAAPVHAQQANWGVLTADVAEARLALERAEKEFARIEQLKARNAISETQFDEKKYELELAKIQLQRAEAKLYAATPVAPPLAAPEKINVTQQTEARLLELDLAEAKLAVEVAEAEVEQADVIRKKNPGGISETEIRKYRLQAERAKIQMQRIMVKLEAVKTEEAGARK